MNINFLIKNLSEIFAFLFLALYITSFSAHSSTSTQNNDIVKQIEKNLIFDKDSRDQIDFYKSNSSKKKSDFTIDASGGESEIKASSPLDILVTDSKIDNLDAREKERLAYNAALIGQYEVAVEIYKQIITAEPENNYAKLSLAIAYQKIGQFSQAKTLYYELLKVDSESQDLVISNLLNILTEESPRDTIYLLSRLVTQNPQSPTILASAAMAYDKIKDYDKAISLLERAVRLDDTRVDYKYNLAIIYDKIAKYENALELYLGIMKSNSSDQNIPLSQIKKRVEFIKKKI
jgi:tetratricopeptide (TPR) repeat protein